jgi:TRAP-type C4-dicarboxylate transport system permease small subunit
MRMFAWGLVLFLCCDLCVGVFNQSALFSDALYAAAKFGMWLFYLPGQVLIALSGLPDFS